MGHRSFATVLLTIVVFSFAGRVAYIVTVTRHQKNPSLTSPVSGAVRSFDELYYQEGARHLVKGEGFKTPLLGPPNEEAAYHPPMTILVLAPAAWLAGGSVVAMRLTMALAGSVVVALAGLIGRKVAGDRAGLFAAGIAAIYPNLWMNDGILMGETLATLGTAATVLFAYRLGRRPRWTSAVGAGASIAFAALSRAELTLLFPLLLLPVVLLVGNITIKKRLMLVSIAALAALFGVAPWVVYNLSRFEKPVFISYADGDSLIGANCKRSYYGPLLGFQDGTCGLAIRSAEPSVEAAERRSQAIHYARQHLDRLPIVMSARVGRVWGVYRTFQMIDLLQTEGRPKVASTLGWVMYLVLMCLAVGGATTLRRRRTAVIPLLAPIVIVTVTVAITFGSPRFRAPAEIAIVVLAATALDALANRRHPLPAAADVAAAVEQEPLAPSVKPSDETEAAPT